LVNAAGLMKWLALGGLMSQRREGADVIQTVGLISFVAIWVGAVIAVFDADLWLKEESVYTNALTYGMATFTLQGMGFFFYKLLAQESLESNAKIARMQRDQKEQMQHQQMQFSQKQMEMEMRRQQIDFEQQLKMLEDDPEVVQYMALQEEMMRRAKAAMEIPQHAASKKESLDLGAKSKRRGTDGRFVKDEE
tara:strand:+ start:5814 stop:6392 length:579 start_codon:yes stop_codon:yes gene_type:complete